MFRGKCFRQIVYPHIVDGFIDIAVMVNCMAEVCDGGNGIILQKTVRLISFCCMGWKSFLLR